MICISLARVVLLEDGVVLVHPRSAIRSVCKHNMSCLRRAMSCLAAGRGVVAAGRGVVAAGRGVVAAGQGAVAAGRMQKIAIAIAIAIANRRGTPRALIIAQ